MENNNNESSDSLTRVNTVWLHDKNQLRKHILDERLVEVIHYYVSVYKEIKGHWHPRISKKQLATIENNLADIDVEYSVSLLDEWEWVIIDYWESGNIGDGNINRFASGDWSQGVLAGMLK